MRTKIEHRGCGCMCNIVRKWMMRIASADGSVYGWVCEHWMWWMWCGPELDDFISRLDLEDITTFCLFYSFLFGEWLLYNVVLGSSVQQCKSALSIHMLPPPEPPSHSPPHSSPLCCHRAQVWAPCIIQHLLTSIYFTPVIYMFQCCSFNSSHPLLPSLCPQVYPLLTSLLLPWKEVHWYCFLDTIYIHYYTIFVFVFDLLHSV